MVKTKKKSGKNLRNQGKIREFDGIKKSENPNWDSIKITSDALCDRSHGTPWADTPHRQTRVGSPPTHTHRNDQMRAVCILLECFLPTGMLSC